MSYHAANNLNLKKWNKVTIVLLESVLTQHLINLAKKSLEVFTKQVEGSEDNIEVEDL